LSPFVILSEAKDDEALLASKYKPYLEEQTAPLRARLASVCEIGGGRGQSAA
jgi:hypothetical protein